MTTMKKTTFKQCAAGDVFEHQGQALIKTTKPNTAVNLNSGAFAHFHDGDLRLNGSVTFTAFVVSQGPVGRQDVL